MSNFSVYLITNRKNGKRYVGMTGKSVEKRWRKHLSRVKTGRGRGLHAAIREHGEDQFELETLLSGLTQEEALAAEIEYIEKYNTFANSGHGYNLTRGGDGAFGVEISEETRRKIAEAKRGRTVSEETRRKIGEARKNCAKKYEYNGYELSVPEWAAKLGICERRIRDHLRCGHTIELTLMKCLLKKGSL